MSQDYTIVNVAIRFVHYHFLSFLNYHLILFLQYDLSITVYTVIL
uniref:Uncharacterized protein n=1 Tax=Ascaris lumbricoides TaxID=6252 RepID=A0A0M3IBM9_ASCLU